MPTHDDFEPIVETRSQSGPLACPKGFNHHIIGSRGAVESRLFSLDQDILVLTRTLKAAQIEREELCRAVRRAANSAAPIGRLPNELICEVFATNISTGPLGQWEDAGNVEYAQHLRTITSTCVSWRGIALEMPQLWRRIFYRLDHPQFDRTHAFLQRSKSLSLTIGLDLTSVTAHDVPTALQLGLMMKIFRPHLARCQALTIRAASHDTAYLLLPIPGPMPSLQHFAFTSEKWGVTRFPDALSPVTDPSVHLQSLVLNPQHEILPIRLDTFDITSLKYLHIGAGISCGRALELINRCQALDTLVWYDGKDDHATLGIHDEPETVILPNLKIFAHTIGISPPVNHGIRAPNLEHLCLGSIDDDARAIGNALSNAFNIQPFAHLHTLWISSTTSPGSSILIPFLRAHPSLEAIGIPARGDTVPQILDLITLTLPSTADDAFLPNLRELHIHSVPCLTKIVGSSRTRVRDFCTPVIVSALSLFLSTSAYGPPGRSDLDITVMSRPFGKEEEGDSAVLPDGMAGLLDLYHKQLSFVEDNQAPEFYQQTPYLC